MPHKKITSGTRWATRALPPDMRPFHSLNLADWKLMLAINIVGVALLFIFGWLFIGIAAAINPEFFLLEMVIFARILTIQALIVTILIVMVLHEFLHGFFFFLFSGAPPRIGFHLLYAYAAAPDYAFKSPAFLIIGAAPLLGITLIGLALLPTASFALAARIILALTVNAAGSIGDILVVAWLLSQPADCWIVDDGARITLYRPQPQGDEAGN